MNVTLWKRDTDGTYHHSACNATITKVPKGWVLSPTGERSPGTVEMFFRSAKGAQGYFQRWYTVGSGVARPRSFTVTAQ